MINMGENSVTKLPEINNYKKGESNGFVGPISGDVKAEIRSNEPISARANSLSRHSSLKSVQIQSVRGQRSLIGAKQNRQQIEKDAELLANRIALLKQEEMRTWKKIEETRKRAQDVLEMKRINEERIKK
jgi:hypothetical protein